MDEHRIKRAMEQARYHLVRAESELQAVQGHFDPRTGHEAEMALVRAVANSRTSVGDALETIRTRLGK